MKAIVDEMNQLVTVERRGEGEDEAGQPLDVWEPVGELYVGIANETGLGAIRSGLQGNVPASIARYSFMGWLEEVQRLAIDAGMRIVHDGLVFDVKGVVRDLQRRDRAYILCEQGGTTG